MKNKYTLLPFTLSYIEELRSWFNNKSELDKWAGPNFRFPHTTETFSHDMRHQELASFCLFDAQQAFVAFGQYYQRLNCCHLGRLVVNPNHRGKGIAKVLIEQLSTLGIKTLSLSDLQLKTQPIKNISLFVLADNAPALTLYQKLGFKAQNYPEVMPLDNCLYMVK